MALTEEEEFELYYERTYEEFCRRYESSVLAVSRVGRPRRFADNVVFSVRIPRSSVIRLREYCKQNSTSVPDLINEFILSL